MKNKIFRNPCLKSNKRNKNGIVFVEKRTSKRKRERERGERERERERQTETER